MSELIQIVDEQDQPIGGATKEQAWREGLIHRIAHIVVRRANGLVVMQRRADTMSLWPGRWSMAAAGHVTEGEAYAATARRELAEELLITDAELEARGQPFFWEGRYKWRNLRRFNQVFSLVVPDDLTIRYDPGEVSGVANFSLERVHGLIERGQVTDPLPVVLETYLANNH